MEEIKNTEEMTRQEEIVPVTGGVNNKIPEEIDDASSKMELLEKCLEASIDGQVGVFLEEVAWKNEEIVAENEASRRITDKCKPVFRFAGGYIFLTLSFNQGELDLKSMKLQFTRWLEKCDEAFRNPHAGELEREWHYVVNIAGALEDGTYVMELYDPCFMWQDGEDLCFSFPQDRLSLHKLGVDYGKMEKTLDYEARMRDNRWDDIAPDPDKGIDVTF